MTGNTTSGSNVVTGLSSTTTGLAVGMAVGGTGIPVGATVATIVSSTSITLSVDAISTNTGISLVFSLFSTTQSVYDAVGNVIEVIDPLGNATQTVYDSLNRATSTLYANFTAVSKTYTPANLVTTETDQAGSVTTHEYDAAARHIEIYQPDPVTGTKTVNSPLTQKGYDPVGNMTSLINPLGNEWTYVYDNRNRRIEEIEPPVANAEAGGSPMVNPTVLTGYDGVGNVTSKTDPRGYVTTMEYDNANRLIETIYPAVPVYESGSPVAATTLTGYDLNGNIVQVTDDDGNETVNTYDALNRLTTTTTSSVSDSSIMTLVKAGNTTSGSATISDLANTTGITTGMGVSGTGIPSGTTVSSVGSTTVTLSASATATNTGIAVVFTSPATNIVEQFAYDQVGNRTQVTDGKGLITSFTYDGLNRLLVTQYDPGTAAATTVAESYNALNKVERTEGTGLITQYLYDVLNRITDVIYLSSTVDNLHYGRDAVGNVLLVVHPNEPGSLRDVIYTYDRLNRHLSENSDGVTQTHTYDAVGNRLTTVYGGTNRTLTYTYDTLNRLAGMADSELSPGPSTSWIVKTAAYLAAAGDKIQADTSSGVFTITLPAFANPGDTILIQDATLSWNTGNLTIARNGLLINGVSSDYTASVQGNKLSVVYISTTYGWSIK